MKRKDESMVLAEEAFWQLLADGVPPTVDLINNRLADEGHGRRDRNVISTVAKSCWTKVGERVQTSFSLPGIPEDTVRLFVKLREDLLGIARAEFDAERAATEATATARVQAVEQQLATARTDAEEARSTQRETAAAYEALASDRDRLRTELNDANARALREKTHSGQLQTELAAITTRLEAESRRADDQRAAADAERKRQALEIDGLRTELRTLKEDVRKAHQQAEESRQREREQSDRIATLSQELGVSRGVEQAQATQIVDLSRERDAAHAETARHAAEHATELAQMQQRIEQANGELGVLQQLVEHRAGISREQLGAALTKAWLTGATHPVKSARGDDPASALAQRAERYAAKELKGLGESSH